MIVHHLYQATETFEKLPSSPGYRPSRSAVGRNTGLPLTIYLTAFIFASQLLHDHKKRCDAEFARQISLPVSGAFLRLLEPAIHQKRRPVKILKKLTVSVDRVLRTRQTSPWPLRRYRHHANKRKQHIHTLWLWTRPALGR